MIPGSLILQGEHHDGRVEITAHLRKILPPPTPPQSYKYKYRYKSTSTVDPERSKMWCFGTVLVYNTRVVEMRRFVVITIWSYENIASMQDKVDWGQK